MKKRFFFITLAILCSLNVTLFTACSDDDDNDDKKPTPASTPASVKYYIDNINYSNNDTVSFSKATIDKTLSDSLC